MFPIVEAVNGGYDVSETTHTINLPTGIVANDLLLVFFVSDAAETVTFPAGWVKLFCDVNGVAVTFGCWYKFASGSEGATISVTTGTTEATAHTSYRISSAHGWHAPEVATSATGTSINPNPPALTPTWGERDTLWIACQGHDGGNDLTTAYPTNYTNGREDTYNASGGAGVATARRELNAASEDPVTFTIENSEEWVANVVAISNAAIDIGSAATDRTDDFAGGRTVCDIANPANDTGKIDTIQVYFVTGANAQGVKVGTLYGLGTNKTNRDFETLGTVTAGSQQEFTGLDCAVATDDYIAIYFANTDNPALEQSLAGGVMYYYSSGDQLNLGAISFEDNYASRAISVYGTGETEPPYSPSTRPASMAAKLVGAGVI